MCRQNGEVRYAQVRYAVSHFFAYLTSAYLTSPFWVPFPTHPIPSTFIPGSEKKPGREVAGKHPLNGRTNAALVLAVGHPFQRKTKGNWGNDYNKPGREVAGKHPLNGPGKQGRMYRLLPGLR